MEFTMAELKTNAVRIREALPADGPALVDAIMAINEETEFLGTSEDRPLWAKRPEQGLREMRERGSGVYFVAIEAGEMAGFLGAFPGGFERSRGIVYVAHVGVRAAHRGRGIGPRLLAAVETWAREQKARRLELRVDVANPQALALYRRCGFEIEGRVPDAARIGETWRDHYWMSRPLTAELEPCWAPLDLRPSPERAAVGAVSIRAIAPDDAARLQAWERAILSEAPFFVKQPKEVAPIAQIQKEIGESTANPRHFVRCAFFGVAGRERMVGHAGAWFDPWSRSRHDGFVSVSVLREASGLGIGRRLWAEVETWARQRGARRLTGVVQAHNLRGLAFAEATGFRREAVARNYVVIDGRSVDRLRLGKLMAQT
jgi:RimJ/RimL family protein N-acetyltransferase